MNSDPGIGASPGAPWYRVVAIPDVCYGGTAERDYASVLPALLNAAQRRRPFVAGWLSRGRAARRPPSWPAAGPGRFGQLAGQALTGAPWLGGGPGLAAAAPTLFEAALTTLMTRPFGWLVVAEPTDLIDAEIAELRSELNVLGRFDEEQSRFEAYRAASRLAELDAFREAGLLNVRVLVGAADAEQLSVIAPILVGSADLSAHPYRLRAPERARDLADALAAKIADEADGSALPGNAPTRTSPGAPDAAPRADPPPAPDPGYPGQAHIDRGAALFRAAFDGPEPFPQIMSQALQRVYESCGWDPVSGAGRPGAVVPPAVPTLAQLQAAALEVISGVGYGPELPADVRGLVDVWLLYLRPQSAGRF